jgi:ribose-phosphate pyrophosphokinase
MRSPLTIYFFEESASLANKTAAILHARSLKIHERRFPDGESLVEVEADVAHEAVVLRSLDHPDGKLMPTLLAADALRRRGARNVTLVAPYLAYMRQDKIFAPGQPISQLVIGDILARYFDRVLTIEAHLHRIRRLSEVVPSRRRSESLSGAPAIANWVRATCEDCVIIGPDKESRPWVEAIAKASGKEFAVGDKRRTGDRKVSVDFGELPAYRRAIIVDDIASSGATLAAAARALRTGGIRAIDAVVVHAIFASGAHALIRSAGIRKLVSCDTIAHRSSAISVAPLLAEALA